MIFQNERNEILLLNIFPFLIQKGKVNLKQQKPL